MQIVVLIVLQYVLYRLLSILLWKMSAIRYNVLDGRAFSHGCYRPLVEYKDSCFLSIFFVVFGEIFML